MASMDDPAPREAALPPAAGEAAASGFPAVRRTRFADQAYAYLFHKITTGEFKEGEMLPSENELCAAFEISRPVVRQALQRLRSDGLIASRRGSGSFVQPRRPADVSEAYKAGKLRELLDNLEFRTVVEPQAAFLAAQRRTGSDLEAMHAAANEFEQVAVIDGRIGHHLDFRFHLALATATGNRRFVEAIRAVEYDIDHGVNLVRFLVRFDHLERSRKVHAEHAGILAAIERRDAEDAAARMRAHLDQARIRMMETRPDRTPGSPPSRKSPSLDRSGAEGPGRATERPRQRRGPT
jgi:DNA-binding FadR family transcriptional regulator